MGPLVSSISIALSNMIEISFFNRKEQKEHGEKSL